MRIVKIPDYLRGGSDEIIIRFDPNDVVKLPCHCKYDPLLSKPSGENEVMILRKVEIQNKDGSWSLYPSVSWLDGIENEEQLVTRAIVKLSKDGGIYLMESSQGVPDGKLMFSARKAGIYTEFVDGE